MPDVWTLEIACALCGAKETIEVHAGQTPQRYCSKTCKRRAGRRRYKARRRQLEQLAAASEPRVRCARDRTSAPTAPGKKPRSPSTTSGRPTRT